MTPLLSFVIAAVSVVIGLAVAAVLVSHALSAGLLALSTIVLAAVVVVGYVCRMGSPAGV